MKRRRKRKRKWEHGRQKERYVVRKYTNNMNFYYVLRIFACRLFSVFKWAFDFWSFFFFFFSRLILFIHSIYIHLLVSFWTFSVFLLFFHLQCILYLYRRKVNSVFFWGGGVETNSFSCKNDSRQRKKLWILIVVKHLAHNMCVIVETPTNDGDAVCAQKTIFCV